MWVAWREGNKLPSLVIEMLSPASEANDRGHKFCLYRDTLKVKLGFHDGWLRWFEPGGAMLLTGTERADQERLRADEAEAETARLRAELARLRAESSE